jgi:hypothetical protein
MASEREPHQPSNGTRRKALDRGLTAPS